MTGNCLPDVKFSLFFHIFQSFSSKILIHRQISKVKKIEKALCFSRFFRFTLSFFNYNHCFPEIISGSETYSIMDILWNIFENSKCECGFYVLISNFMIGMKMWFKCIILPIWSTEVLVFPSTRLRESCNLINSNQRLPRRSKI